MRVSGAPAPRRAAPACSSMVRAVPREIRSIPAIASVRVRAPGSLRTRCAARQSVGTTSNPAPGRSMTPAFRAAGPIARSAWKTGISPVRSR